MATIFERASKQKLRFQTARGMLSVEDLWDLSVEQLDAIFKPLNKSAKEQDEESLLDTTKASKEKTMLNLQIDIIKHIVEVKLTAQAATRARAEKREKRNKLLSLMAEKQDAELAGKSIEDLQKELDALDEDDND